MASQAPIAQQTEHGDEPRSEPATNRPNQAVTEQASASQRQSARASILSSTSNAYNIGGSYRDIFWALTCVSLPMLLVTGIFIGLVYANQVSNHDDLGANPLSTSQSTDSAAYYIAYSAPRLITVSSWASTVASFTATFIMVLVSYPIAKSYANDSKSGSIEKVPTAYQLRLIIGVLGGGLGSLWSWLQYCFWRKRTRQTRALWLPGLSLLGATILAFAILAADTWLHITTSTVNFDAISQVSQPTLSYGRGLESSCYDRTWPTYEVCTGGAVTGGYQFPSLLESTQTLTNFSTINAVLPATLGNKAFAYLTAAQRNPDVDYLANTFAVSTQCSPASKTCQLQVNEGCNSGGGCVGADITAGMPYNCGPSLYGDLMSNTGTPFNSEYTNGTSATSSSSTGFFLQLFKGPSFSNPLGQTYGYQNVSNPFYSAIGGRVAVGNTLGMDSQAIYNDMTGDSGFIFSCQTTFYDARYKVINGTVVVESYSPSNNTLPSNSIWTFANYFAYTRTALESAFISGAQQANTSQQFANFVGQRTSEILLSMTVGATTPSQNVAEQTREHLLVTRLPKAPFFVLIILNLLYALLGIVLAVLALASQPRKTRNVQSRLTVGGLVAALLEAHLPEHVTSSGKSNSGIEGAFAEYYNDDKHKDEGRVLVSSGFGNTAFERIFLVPATASSHVLTKTHDHAGPNVMSGEGNEDVPTSSPPSRTASSVQPERDNRNSQSQEAFSPIVPNQIREDRNVDASVLSSQAQVHDTAAPPGPQAVEHTQSTQSAGLASEETTNERSPLV